MSNKLLIILLFLYTFSSNAQFTGINDSLIHHYYSFYNQNLGNIGHESYLNIEGYYNSKYLINDFELYQGKNHYDTNRINSEFLYLIGSYNEVYFDMYHSQKVAKNVFLFIDYTRINSEGGYFNQEAINSDLDVGILLKSNRFENELGYTFDNTIDNLNGGITNDSSFENNEFSNPKAYGVSLLSASNKIKKHKFYNTSYFKLTQDTIGGFKISNYIEYSDMDYSFVTVNPSNTIFNDIFLDSNNTLDFYRNKVFFDKVGIEYSQDNHWFNISVGYQDYKYFNRYELNKFDNYLLNSKYRFRNKRVNFGIEADYHFSGYNSEGYNLSAELGYTRLPFFDSVLLNVNSFKLKPIPFYGNYSSNHFKWNNTLDFHFHNTFRLRTYSRKNRLGLRIHYEINKNNIYFDSVGIQQKDENSNLFSVSIFKYFQSGNFHADIEYTYQNSSGLDIIRRPEHILFSSVYYQNKVFKKLMKLQLGFDFYYYSNFFANTYHPSLNQYYIQDNTEVGNYLYADFFINSYIRNFELFFKISHLNEGLISRNFYAAPLYPNQKVAFKVGLKWKLFN